MKPVIIIAITASVSVGAILGIIFGILKIEVDVDYSDIALVLSIITALAVSIVAFASVSASKSAKKLGMAQLMEGIDTALKDVMAREDTIENRTSNLQYDDDYVTDYVNILDRICYTKNQGAFDESVIVFYKPFLAYGLLLLEWKNRTYEKDNSEEYSDLIEVCKNHGISKPDWSTLRSKLRDITEHLEAQREKAKKLEEEKAKSETDSSSQDKTQQDSEEK